MTFHYRRLFFVSVFLGVAIICIGEVSRVNGYDPEFLHGKNIEHQLEGLELDVHDTGISYEDFKPMEEKFREIDSALAASLEIARARQYSKKSYYIVSIIVVIIGAFLATLLSWQKDAELAKTVEHKQNKQAEAAVTITNIDS